MQFFPKIHTTANVTLILYNNSTNRFRRVISDEHLVLLVLFCNKKLFQRKPQPNCNTQRCLSMIQWPIQNKATCFFSDLLT